MLTLSRIQILNLAAVLVLPAVYLVTHPPAFAVPDTTAPAPERATSAESAQRLLWPLAEARDIGGVDPQWVYYEGDPPPGLGTSGQVWSLSEFAARQHSLQWAIFADALRLQFPEGVQVYQFARPEGKMYLVLGRAQWGSGGFVGSVKG